MTWKEKKIPVRITTPYQVIFVSAFTFDMSVTPYRIQRKIVRQFAV